MKPLWVIIGVSFVGLALSAVGHKQIVSSVSTPKPTLNQITIIPTPSSPTSTPTPTQPALVVTPTPTPTPPASYTIANVPFIEQAPLKNWDAFHEETCEEAAMLAVVHYLKGDTNLSKETQEQKLADIVTWEKDHPPINPEDETAAEVAKVLRDYFGYGERVRVINLKTSDDIKREVAAGRPVLVPAAGKLLKNRYFKQPGPIYHMTVVIGYTKNNFITNDPGTQHGQNYSYPATTFWDAIHDFVDRTDEGMATGAKVAVVID